MPRARPVRPDAIIDVVAPASAFDRANFDGSVAWLKSKGFRPRFRDDLFEKDRFLAGSDQRRLDELVTALDAPDSDLLWCVRGGYGATRLLADLSITRIRAANKLLIGFSDITALHERWRVADVPSLHASMVARLGREPADVLEQLFVLLSPDRVAPPLSGKPLVPGRVEGMTAGGNLALLTALCGTPYQPDFTGAVVLIEDVGERPYRLDRMFVQCEQAGLFRGVAGLAFGEFLDCGEPEAPTANAKEHAGRIADTAAARVIEEHARRIGVPAVVDLQVGHGAINRPFPLGVRARLDATAGQLTFLESLT